MFAKLKQLAAKCLDKIRWSPPEERAPRSAVTSAQNPLAPRDEAKRRRLPAWRIREFQEASKFGTSRHRDQRGQRGCFGSSRANREALFVPITRKEQHRLGWWLAELPDENS